MITTYRTKSKDLFAVIGPGIGFDSFQVGEEVPQIFKEVNFPFELVWKWDGAPESDSMKGGHHIDLKAANKWLLMSKGVKEENIFVSDIDTFMDERFFSARREGFECGRNINSIRINSYNLNFNLSRFQYSNIDPYLSVENIFVTLFDWAN